VDEDANLAPQVNEAGFNFNPQSGGDGAAGASGAPFQF